MEFDVYGEKSAETKDGFPAADRLPIIVDNDIRLLGGEFVEHRRLAA